VETNGKKKEKSLIFYCCKVCHRMEKFSIRKDVSSDVSLDVDGEQQLNSSSEQQ
jgi:hypothetical protein